MLRIAEIGLGVALCFSVLAFGGTGAFFLVPQLIVLGTGVLIVANSLLFPRYSVRFPIIVPVLLLALVLLQILPLPFSVASLFGMAHGNSSVAGYFTLSIAPYETASQILQLITYLVALYLAALVTARDKKAKKRVMHILICLGTFEALYGIVQYLSGWQYIFTYPKKYYLEDATGTYINRNHFAGLLEMVLPFAVAMVLAEARNFARARARNGTASRGIFSSKELTRVTFWLFVAGLLFTAILLSHSRMGYISTLASLIAISVLAGSSHLRVRTRVLIGAPLLATILALSVWIGSGPAIQRFETLSGEYGQTGQNRMSIWLDTVKLIQQRPILGSGLGTFAEAYPSVQTAFLDLLVDHAHSDYLEAVTELGFPGAMLLFGSIFWVLAQAVRRSAKADDSLDRTLCLGCTGGVTAMLVHSFADFNLHIPANVLVFSVILALAWSATQSQRDKARRAVNALI